MKMKSNIIQCVNALLSIYPRTNQIIVWFLYSFAIRHVWSWHPLCNWMNAHLKNMMCLTTCARGDECSFLKGWLIIGQCLSLNNWLVASLIPAHGWPDQSGCEGTNASIMTWRFEPIRKESVFVNMYKAIKMCLFAYGSQIHIHSVVCTLKFACSQKVFGATSGKHPCKQNSGYNVFTDNKKSRQFRSHDTK